MSEILVKDYEEVSENREEAANRLHAEIMANGQIAASALLEFCKGLKRMRDEKLYTELGFKTFDDYVEQKAGIKSRMAYHYISVYENLGSTFLQSNAQLGITKLSILTKLSPEARLEIAESGEAENMSVRELEEKIKMLTDKNEQLSLLTAEAKKSGQESEQKLKALLEKSEQETAELKRQLDEALKTPDPEADAPDEEEIRAEAEREVKEKYEKMLADSRERAAEKLAKERTERESAIKSAVQKAEKEAAEKAEKKFAALSGEKERYEAELSDLKKKQGLGSDSRAAEFQFHFKAMQNEVKTALALIADIGRDNPETSAKLTEAMQKYFMIILDNTAKPTV